MACEMSTSNTEESVKMASSDILRIKIALACAIIKNCPPNVTPEMFAIQLSTKRCHETVMTLQKEIQLREESTCLRQKLIDNNLKMDEILFLKKRGNKRKSELTQNNTDDIHNQMLNKVKTDYLTEISDTLNSQNVCYRTEPHKAHQFLKTFLNLREQNEIDTIFTSSNQEEKVLNSINAIDFLIGEIFWAEKNSFTDKSSVLMLNSFSKIVQTIGNVMEMLSSTTDSCLRSKTPLTNMLRRIIDQLRLFIWNIVKCSSFDLVEKSWKPIMDRLLVLSKCGATLNWCLCHALIEIIFLVSLHMRTSNSKDTSSHDVRSSMLKDSVEFGSYLEPHVLENSGRIFFLLEGILAMTNRNVQSDLKRLMNAEAKKLLNLSLLHAMETYPLFTIRVWEVMNHKYMV